MQTAAHTLAKKLEKFGRTLEPEEQEVLNTILRLYTEAAEDRINAIETLTEKDEKELEPVRAALAKRNFDAAGNAMTTPCWTVTTTTTTVQTADWLCHPIVRRA